MTDQEVVIKLIHLEGLNFFRTRLLGSSDMRYVTKRMETAVWYWFPCKRRSSSMPYSLALPSKISTLCSK